MTLLRVSPSMGKHSLTSAMSWSTLVVVMWRQTPEALERDQPSADGGRKTFSPTSLYSPKSLGMFACGGCDSADDSAVARANEPRSHCIRIGGRYRRSDSPLAKMATEADILPIWVDFWPKLATLEQT